MAVFRILFFILCLSLPAGCGTSIRVTVDSINDSGRSAPGKDYVLASGMPEISTDDLYFREFSSYFQKALENRGYTRVASRDNADLEISLRYGISEGRNAYFTYDRPIYDFIGGETIVYTTTRKGKDGKISKTTETVHLPSRHALIGYTTETAARTIHTSFAIVEAENLTGGRETRTLWKTTLRHTSEINDLRRLMPYFAAAAQDYLGENTGIAQTIKLKPSNPAVEEMLPAGLR